MSSEKNELPAPDVDDASCDSRDSDPPVRGGENDLEAPKKPRSAAQLAAFERARAKRAENLKKKQAPEKKYEPEEPEEPEEFAQKEDEPEEAPKAPKKTRKVRSDKGKPRGFLVRHKPVREPVEFDEEPHRVNEESSQAPKNLYEHFIIV